MIRSFLADLRLPFFVALCLLFGGASAAGWVANGMLQLIAIILMASVLLAFGAADVIDPDRDTGSVRAPVLFLIVGAFVVWVLLQLIPMPPALWHLLPAREPIIEGERLLRMSSGWRPLSMDPEGTLVSLVGLLPAIATLVMAVPSTGRARRWTLWVILWIAIASCVFGLVQLQQGETSPSYFYDITNSNTSVGFFSNSNHFATLMVLAIVLVRPAVSSLFESRRRRKGSAWLQAGLVALFLTSLLVNGSLAGYILALPATLFWISHLPIEGRPWFDRIRDNRVPIFLGGGVLASIGVFALRDQLLKLSSGLTDPFLRLHYSTETLRTAWDAFPFGTGFGSFRWAYAATQDPGRIELVYVNHAHNDYAEFLMEGGVIGILFGVALVFWILRAIWRSRALGPHVMGKIDFAIVAIGLIAAHSLVDYPLRTAGIAAVAAFCLGLLASPDGGRDWLPKRPSRR